MTYNGGQSWQPLGTGFPTVEIWQLNLDPANRNLAAGTHGRGAWTMHDAAAVPALVVSKADAGVPVAAGSRIDYTITLQNIGNADATGVTITDPIPDDTTFTSRRRTAARYAKGKVTWSGLTVAAGDSIDVHFSVTIKTKLGKKVDSIVDDGLTVTSAQGIGTTGSAHVTPIAPPYGVDRHARDTRPTARAPVARSTTPSTSRTSAPTTTPTRWRPPATYRATVLDATCATPISSIALASGAAPTSASGWTSRPAPRTGRPTRRR